MLLKGQVAVVTGAATKSGIGKAIARMFAEHGARTAILDLSVDQAQQAAADLGEDHRGYACDVTDQQRCRVVIEQILAEFGRIDVLANIAGITQPLKLMDIKPDDYEAVTDVSLRGTLYMSQAVIPHLRSRGSGSIICMSSVSAQRGGGIFGGPHYSAAKAGVLGLMRAMARDLGPDGIRVNALTPGLIKTDITGGLLTEERTAEICADIPLGRLGRPVDVAGACLFLASELSAYVTGAVIDINGGMFIH